MDDTTLILIVAAAASASEQINKTDSTCSAGEFFDGMIFITVMFSLPFAFDLLKWRWQARKRKKYIPGARSAEHMSAEHMSTGHMSTTWKLTTGTLFLIQSIEEICPAFGFHVALTGGVLYKEGERKDLDILFYRIRQTEMPDYPGLIGALCKIGVKVREYCGPWLTKAEYEGRGIDMFFPEDPFKRVSPKPKTIPTGDYGT